MTSNSFPYLTPNASGKLPYTNIFDYFDQNPAFPNVDEPNLHQNCPESFNIKTEPQDSWSLSMIRADSNLPGSRNSADEDIDRLFEDVLFLSDSSDELSHISSPMVPALNNQVPETLCVIPMKELKTPGQPTSNRPPPCNKMKKFPPNELHDLKHIIYNLLVDWFNGENDLVRPYSVVHNGKHREGFQFNEEMNPDKQIPELYAKYIRNSRLDLANPDSCIIQDLYKFYMRACLDLLAKYFEKLDKYTFLCDDIVLFIPGETLDQAESRLRTMKSLARKRQGHTSNAARGRKKRTRKA